MKKLLFVLFAAVMLCGCGTQEEESKELQKVSRDVFAMDTFMQLTAYGEQAQEAVDQAADEIVRLDGLLSTGKETSEIFLLNQNGKGILSEESVYLLERSMELYKATEGAFTVAIYPMMRAWGFTSGEYGVPEEAELTPLFSLMDMEQISYNPDTKEVSFLQEGMEIDFGGIAKGYTSSRMMEIFSEYGITSGMVNLGGNVQVLGTKPDGSLWKVGIESPDKEDYLGILEVSDKAVITSGGYERYFEEDGVHYHHIIDPKTGYPANNGLVSVTIVSADGTLADGLSTSLFVMGKEKAIAYWGEHSEAFDAILLTDQDELFVTEGIADSLSTEYEMHVIRQP